MTNLNDYIITNIKVGSATNSSSYHSTTISNPSWQSHVARKDTVEINGFVIPASLTKHLLDPFGSINCKDDVKKCVREAINEGVQTMVYAVDRFCHDEGALDEMFADGVLVDTDAVEVTTCEFFGVEYPEDGDNKWSLQRDAFNKAKELYAEKIADGALEEVKELTELFDGVISADIPEDED